MEAIKISNLNKWYSEYHVLKNINLSINQAEKIVVIGPSGSGKSSMIRCINYLEDFQSGEIIVNGLHLTGDISNINAIRQQVGMVFQNFNLFPHLTILENCMLAPRTVKKLTKAEARDLAMELLQQVKIVEQADKYPSQLSGGQQQRAAIARALCMQPKIMLFDEPTSALDPEMVQEVLDTILGLAKKGMTMICVTHEMEFAKNLADRVVFMDKGEIIEIQPAADFFANPTQIRTQQFLGKLQ